MIRVKQTYPEVKTYLTEMNKLEETLQKEGIEYRRIDDPGEKVTKGRSAASTTRQKHGL